LRAYVAPYFTQELEDRGNVAEGGTVALTAHVEAYPAIGLTWHRAGIRFRPSRRHAVRLDSDGTVSLVLNKASASARHDAAVYTCTVSNEMGRVSSSARISFRQQTSSSSSAALIDPSQP